MNSILITGGSGFIGSNFIRLLLSNDASLLKENGYNHLINLDALTYAGNPANLSDLEGSEDYEFVHASILEQERIEELLWQRQHSSQSDPLVAKRPTRRKATMSLSDVAKITLVAERLMKRRGYFRLCR